MIELSNVPKNDLQWLAGIIDSEGSFRIFQNRSSRACWCRICTTDDIIIPYVCQLIGKTPKPKPKSGLAKLDGLQVRIVGSECRQLAESLVDYVYLKRPHVDCVLTALRIKNGVSSHYTTKENELWHDCVLCLKKLNQKGPLRLQYDGPRNYNFSWAWFAGLVDGDGSIHPAKFVRNGNTTVKPCLSISLTNYSTINYIANKLHLTVLNYNSKGNRAKCKKVRILSTGLVRILPHIIPHLKLKKKLAEVALLISDLKLKAPKENQIIQHELNKFVQLCGYKSLQQYNKSC